MTFVKEGARKNAYIVVFHYIHVGWYLHATCIQAGRHLVRLVPTCTRYLYCFQNNTGSDTSSVEVGGLASQTSRNIVTTLCSVLSAGMVVALGMAYVVLNSPVVTWMRMGIRINFMLEERENMTSLYKEKLDRRLGLPW